MLKNICLFLALALWSYDLPAVETKTVEAESKLFADYWNFLMREYPEWSTMVGVGKYDHLWTDHSPKSYERRQRKLKSFLTRAQALSTSSLNLDIFKRQLRGSIEAYGYAGHLMPINQLWGIQQDAAQTLSTMSTKTKQDLENIVARLKNLPRAIEQNINLLKTGLSQGLTPPRITLREVGNQIKAQIVDEPRKSPLLTKFASRPETVPEKDFNRLKFEAESIYKKRIKPAYEKLHRYFTKTYYPRTRRSIALRDLPQGRLWYAYQVRHFTTSNLTPKQVHDIGLREVARIRKEMEAVMKSSGFKGDFQKFTEFLRTEKRFYFDNAVDLIREYQRISEKAQAGLNKVFSKLPTLGFEVKAVPKYSEKSQTTAYYMPGSLKNNRLGVFYANTYNLASRPKWEMEALTLHEAVPGHHMQIALAEEVGTMPAFRRFGGFTAFVEGWGLYSESLGTEMGFYQDPYAKFGQLSYEMWRAIRLVVDTGMHAMGWSRQQAINFFAKNTGKPLHDITVEIDRYIVWPGQALAYKIGELKIHELRRHARETLGAQFDIRLFHDQILSYGALPLDILETQMKTWIAQQKPQPKK